MTISDAQRVFFISVLLLLEKALTGGWARVLTIIKMALQDQALWREKGGDPADEGRANSLLH